MKKLFFIVALLPILLLGSCKDQEEVTKAEKAALQTAITEAQSIYDAAIVGTNPGQYKQADKDIFKESIDMAKDILNDDEALQAEVDAMTANLKKAQETFASKVIPEISAENLIAHWKLDGNGDDSSGNGHNGTLKAGTESRFPGSAAPTPAKDRHGVDGKALHFANGANIEIPYSDALNPANMTISLWINTDNLEPVAGVSTQYVMSNNRWDTWKLDLPSHGKICITRNVAGGVYNADTNPLQMEAKKWYNPAIVTKDGKAIMYIDGAKIVEWDVAAGAPVAPESQLNFVIGSYLPNDAKIEGASGDLEDWEVESWFTAFHGYLDDIRIYNKALSDAEIEAIYDLEKAQ